jgi:hypothetical protein
VQILASISAAVGSVFKPVGVDNGKDLLTGAHLKDPTYSTWKNDPALEERKTFMEKHLPDGDRTSAGHSHDECSNGGSTWRASSRSSISAPQDRCADIVPLRLQKPNGITTLFATLEVAIGKVQKKIGDGTSSSSTFERYRGGPL